ncbi:uncharacterized protein L201_004277 [Kwoniella dendrophila CBS 6074]|uniref:RING-type E3 ubiquitin transferase (cysteine targeting) n=1 Tax=Kwoniella dendrophila CBS 6074 TaxID=1295534 RepID=A0AAX4JXT9_9TREE
MSQPERTIYPGESPSESSSSALNMLRAPRVNQLDSEDLDSALVSMLSDNLTKSLDNLKASFANGFKPELELVIKLIFFKCGIWSNIRASPGSKLQNLKLISSKTNSPTKRILLLYLILHPPIFPNYIITRLREYSLSNQWSDLPNHDYRKTLWKLLNKLDNISRIWELLGWLGFLWDGKYPSLLMRMLRLRLVPSQPHLTKLVSYEFMNRQLVWGAFTEFLMFSVPLIPPLPISLNPRKYFNQFKSIISPPSIIDYTSIPLSSSLPTKDETVYEHKGIYSKLSKEICPICYSRNSNLPVPLSSTGQGQDLTLPPIQGAQNTNFGHRINNKTEEEEENKVFIPTQTDCLGNCKWCYYCIGEELFKHHERIKSLPKKKHKSKLKNDNNGKSKGGTGDQKDSVQEEDEQEDKWECLRCGDQVSRAWRVGADEEATPI